MLQHDDEEEEESQRTECRSHVEMARPSMRPVKMPIATCTEIFESVTGCTLIFFYKNQVYKNVRLQIVKNLRTC